MTTVRRATTTALSADELAVLRRLLFGAFGGRFDEHDWEHTHGAVVPRVLVAGERALATGYVEGVATREDRRGLGLATLVMAEAGRVVEEGYELGALGDGSGIPGFYQRLGWETWQGPTWAAGPDGPVRTAEEDGSILVLRTPATGELDPAWPLQCDWRAGDVW
jgi:aminoglycoside 2'-N-acetyltransferase I